MNLSNIAIATISWARSDAEARLIEEGLRHLATLNVPVFVVDGGSPDDFLARLRSIPGIAVLEPTGPGLQDHVLQSLEAAAASSREFLLYTESDKKWFFQHRLESYIDLSPVDDAVGVVLPARTPESFATFPQFQQYTEIVINTLTDELIHRPGEYAYGPRLVRNSLMPYLLGLDRDLGWGWQSYVVVVAGRLGYRIVDIPLDLPCPEEQREEGGPQAKFFRVGQLSQHLEGLRHGLRVKL